MNQNDPNTTSAPFRPLENYKISSAPESLYYIANFITSGEETALLANIDAPTARWTSLSHRRLQAHPSPLTLNNILLATPLPNWLAEPVTSRLLQLLLDGSKEHVFQHAPHGKPNHVLINEYKPGQGIMPHEDGNAYWPVVATVSLNAPIVLKMTAKSENASMSKHTEESYSILQEPRSLLITTDNMYTDYLHGISEIMIDENLAPKTIANWDLLGAPQSFGLGSYERQTRISLTYRDVLKVSNLGRKFRLFK